MLIGVVNSYREAVVRFAIRGVGKVESKLEAVVDTGFNGWLTLPPAQIVQFNLPFRRRGLATLADGSETLYDIYEGEILWQGRLLRIPIDEAETDPLIGMALLQGYELRIEVTKGGTVSLRELQAPKLST